MCTARQSKGTSFGWQESNPIAALATWEQKAYETYGRGAQRSLAYHVGGANHRVFPVHRRHCIGMQVLDQ